MKTQARNANPVVTTRCGQVRGRTLDGLHVYKGLPYAAPPVGANHLMPPRPVEPWSGVRDAGSFGAKPPQAAYPTPYDTLLAEQDAVGEDCLNVNVWTPALGSSRRPVLVWIAGGAFEHGTGASYDGSTFARDGVVFVTLNYRVGAEGFLDLGNGNVNRGLLDQIAALRWVQENIAAFGGDPANVTLVGESAGAMSIGTLLTMPNAAGLFHRAILESGAAQQVVSAATGRRVARLLADQLGVDATHNALATVRPERFLEAQAALAADLASRPDPEHWGQEVVRARMLWQPLVDGQVLPAPPLERIATGASADIALIIGNNADEWRFFLVPNGVIDHVTPEWLAAAIGAYGLPVDTALAAYGAAHPDAGSGDLLAALLSDWYVRVPTVRLADAHAANGARTFMYEFAWRSPQFGGRLGACHALEIPFVFDALGPESEPLVGRDAPQHLADSMHRAWIAFATNGDPGWPAYEPGQRATRRFAATTETVYDPLHMERELWTCVR